MLHTVSLYDTTFISFTRGVAKQRSVALQAASYYQLLTTYHAMPWSQRQRVLGSGTNTKKSEAVP